MHSDPIKEAASPENWVLFHWCEEFNLRVEELREIIKRVGPDINLIRHYVVQKLSLGKSGF